MLLGSFSLKKNRIHVFLFYVLIIILAWEFGCLIKSRETNQQWLSLLSLITLINACVQSTTKTAWDSLSPKRRMLAVLYKIAWQLYLNYDLMNNKVVGIEYAPINNVHIKLQNRNANLLSCKNAFSVCSFLKRYSIFILKSCIIFSYAISMRSAWFVSCTDMMLAAFSVSLVFFLTYYSHSQVKQESYLVCKIFHSLRHSIR